MNMACVNTPVNYDTDASIYQPYLNGIPVLIYGLGECYIALALIYLGETETE